MLAHSNGRIEFERRWRAVLLADPCVYCMALSAGLDHIVPKSFGGENNWTNRAPACRRCDMAKGGASALRYLWASHAAQRRLARRIADRERYGHPRLTLQRQVASASAFTQKLLRAAVIASREGDPHA